MAGAELIDGAILKILSGVQSGVEVSLLPGQYGLGSGPDDDIQIIDVSLAPGHLELRISHAGIQIRAAAGPVRTANGVVLDVNSDWQEIEPLDVLTAGTTRLALGPSSALWTSIADAEVEADRPQAPVAARRRPLHTLALPVLALALVTAIAVWYLNTGDMARPGAGESDLAGLEQVRAALSTLPFARDLAVVQQVDGVITVTGYVDTQAERRAAVGAIGAARAGAHPRIWVLEAMRQEIEGLIAAKGRNLSFDVSRKGAVTLDGRIPDDREAETFVMTVREAVPGVSSVDSRLRTPSTLLEQVNALADSSQIRPWVLLRLDDGVIEATGSVPVEKIDAWSGFLQVYARRFAADIGLRSFVRLQDVTRVAAELPVPAISANAVMIGVPSATSADVVLDVARVQRGDFAPKDVLVDAERPAAKTNSNLPLASGNVGTLVRPLTTNAGPGEHEATGDGSQNPSVDRPVEPQVSDLGVVLPAIVGTQVASGDEPQQNARKATGDGSQDSSADRPVEPQASDLGVVLRAIAGTQAASGDQPQQNARKATGGGSQNFSADKPVEPQASDLGAVLRAIAGTQVASGDQPQQMSQPSREAAMQLSGNDGAVSARGTIGEASSENSQSSLEIVLPSANSGNGSNAAVEVSGGNSQPVPVLPRNAARQPSGSVSLSGNVTPSFPSPITDEAAAAVLPASAPARHLTLSDSTRLLLQQWRDDRLPSVSGAQLLLNALQRLSAMLQDRPDDVTPPSRLARQKLHDQYLPAQGLQGHSGHDTCWPGAALGPDDAMTAVFWLDILSVGRTLSLSSFEPRFQLVIMEAAINPRRTMQCVIDAYQGGTVAAQSVFLREIGRNPAFIRFIVRDIAPHTLDISGAGPGAPSRFIQTRSGEKIHEGAAPDIASRLLLVGELGAVLEVANGLAVAIYGGELAWILE
ncbi:type III secretion system YscD/HrpQ family protein [Pseudochelatococcus lubricantis]|uniref:Type III secretion system YscD/HrpQ family protein n=1 Tax=Pseudochelatococcus lubricantis TaxID=1538102 RepID=A0ABX0V4G6_9HYPH|nr:FHA domain-containing protein [Pseudochelatococcus lubricantis]NIJ59414.1 type III secretion system YscD/HrpQ family protein [Pseudochelatococcus lubricantis]